ncbi:MAG: type VII toxin-antitoxin system HepT family RNase toxin [bacterium]
MLDRQVIEQHLLTMEEALANLERYRDVSLGNFENDLSLIWIAEKGLEILIQNLLDIGAHILASEIRNDWDDYREIIRKLGHHGILPGDFAERIQGMAGLRNILIHDYIRVDVGKIYDVLKNRLGDFVEFMSYIQRYMESINRR